MQVSVRFLTSWYESRQAGTLILGDDGTYFDPHAHHSEKDLALLHDIHEVLADIVRRADKLPSHDILTMNTEFVTLGSKNIIFHVARHEQCISVFILSAVRRINVLLLGNLGIDSHFRPGGQHWADYLQSILNTIARQSQMLAISRLWSKGDQEWSLDAEEPAEPSGSARAEPSGASSSGTRAEPSGASSSGTRAEPSGASSSGTRAEPSGAFSSGTRTEPSGASRSGTRAEPSSDWRQQCPNEGRYCLNERLNDPNRQEKFRNLWEKLLAIETEFQNNGHVFDLEEEETWPQRVLDIYTKRFPNIAALRNGQLLTHPNNCGEGQQCPTKDCCNIAFRFMNFLWNMRNDWKSPKGSRFAPY